MESLPHFPSLKKVWCDLRKPNGEICNKVCSNAWNLKRHKQSRHGDQFLQEISFIHHEFDRDGVTFSRTRFWPQELQHVPTRFAPSSIVYNAGAECSAIEDPAIERLTKQLQRQAEQDTSNVSQGLGLGEGTRLGCVSPPQTREDTAVSHTSHPLTRETRQTGVDDCQALNDTPCTAFESPHGTPRKVPREEHGERELHKRKKYYEKDPYPIYDVKRSRKQPQQQRAIDWLKSDAKILFDKYYESVLGQWGVKSGHRGTCILSTAQWQALDPVKLASTFTYSTCPEAKSDRLLYQFADHSTYLTRAIAWFTESYWPRNGIELDNFLGAGPFQCMEGSHLCHQHNCIVHLVYETSALNNERKECHERAKFRRREGMTIPQHCDNPSHDPPCLMQHAALTTYEAYLIQFSILRQAKGMLAIKPPPRPRRHEYNTFEYQLPVLFCGEDSAFQIGDLEHSQRKDVKPDLICGLCKKVRAYRTIIAFWSHLVKTHSDTDDVELLLQEIRRTARLWKDYWAANPNGGGGRNARTVRKLEDVEREGFSWDVVLGWNLL